MLKILNLRKASCNMGKDFICNIVNDTLRLILADTYLWRLAKIRNFIKFGGDL